MLRVQKAAQLRLVPLVGAQPEREAEQPPPSGAAQGGEVERRAVLNGYGRPTWPCTFPRLA